MSRFSVKKSAVLVPHPRGRSPDRAAGATICATGGMMAVESPPDLPWKDLDLNDDSVEVVLDLAYRQLDRQSQQTDRLNSKASWFLGLAGTSLALSLNLFSSLGSPPRRGGRSHARDRRPGRGLDLVFARPGYPINRRLTFLLERAARRRPPGAPRCPIPHPEWSGRRLPDH